MTTLKPFKFTICYRRTTYIFTTSKFTEDDFVNILNKENREKWNSLTLDKRKKIWDTIKNDFPYNIEGDLMDPHNNWMENWDEEENIELNESWDHHRFIKENIVDMIQKLKLD